MTFGPLVDAAWLAANLEEVAVLDVRWSVADGPGRGAYATGHIPGAVFCDLDADLSAAASAAAGRHPLPTPTAFAESMGRLGIGDATRVVGYDDAGGVIVARLWWMLDAIGHEVAVLDGGIQAWGGALSAAATEPEPESFTPVAWPDDRLVSADALEDALGSGLTILDARSAERYATGSSIDARPGHIPGARSAPAGANLSEGHWRSRTDLGDHYAALDASGDGVVAYCGSGVTACADLLGRRQAGLPDGRLYVGSWSMWGSDPARPSTEGPDP